jgi:hypothetical protein
MPLLLSLLKILEAYFNIKSIRARWELERDISNYCDDVQNEILKARSSGNDARADVLRARLLSSSGIVPSRGDSAPVSEANVSGPNK